MKNFRVEAAFKDLINQSTIIPTIDSQEELADLNEND